MKAYTVPAVQFTNCAAETENVAVITATVIGSVAGAVAGSVVSAVMNEILD